MKKKRLEKHILRAWFLKEIFSLNFFRFFFVSKFQEISPKFFPQDFWGKSGKLQNNSWKSGTSNKFRLPEQKFFFSFQHCKKNNKNEQISDMVMLLFSLLFMIQTFNIYTQIFITKISFSWYNKQIFQIKQIFYLWYSQNSSFSEPFFCLFFSSNIFWYSLIRTFWKDPHLTFNPKKQRRVFLERSIFLFQ